MEDYKIEIGRVVLAISGRDKGKHFIVYKIVDENFVEIVDGRTRPLAKPKLKKVKHLKISNVVLEKLAEKILTKKLIHDPEIKSNLRPFNEENQGE